MTLTANARLGRITLALSLLVFCGASTATATVSSLKLNSEPGDYVGQGQQLFVGATDGSFGLDLGFSLPGVLLKVEAPGNSWFLQFSGPYGGLLQVGVYSAVARWPFNGSQPGLSVYGNSRGCNTVTGSFEVKEAVYDVDYKIVSFWATFEQHCEGLAPALRGEIRYNAHVPIELSVPLETAGTDNQPLVLPVTAMDSLGGHVLLTALDLPSGATFADNGNNTGTFAWTPSYGQHGTHIVRFRGQNVQGATETVSSYITVLPSNDDLDDAFAITGVPGMPSLTASMSGATKQFGEPGWADVPSVWFKFVAPTSERLVFHTTGSSFETLPTIYVDATPETPVTFADLVPVATAPVSGSSRVVLETTAGTVYFIAVEGWPSGDSSFTLHQRRAELSRLLWRHTSGAITIWTVDGAGTIVSNPRYGPFSGWEPVKIVVGPDGRTRVLWRHTSGLITIWTLDTAGNIVSHPTHGPRAGWIASDMVIRADGEIQLAWTRPDGALSVWRMPSDASVQWSGLAYGPYTGWQPLGIAVDRYLTRRTLWRGGSGTIGLWSEAESYGAPSFAVYGPYAGWTPVDIAAGSDEAARILWRHSSGAFGLWRQLPNGNISTASYGPYAGWEAMAVATANISPAYDPRMAPDYGDVYSRILWRHTNGGIALWKTGILGNLVASFTYGPFPGWTVVDIAAGPE